MFLIKLYNNFDALKNNFILMLNSSNIGQLEEKTYFISIIYYNSLFIQYNYINKNHAC